MPTGTQIAQFGANPTSGSGVGIDLNGSTNNGPNNQAVGAVWVDSNRTAAMLIGNSSTTASGTWTLNGVTVNGVANTIIRNNSTQSLTIQNTQGSGNQSMSLALGNATGNVVNIDGAGNVVINSVVTGTGGGLTLNGTSTGILILSGANTYTGGTTINSGTVQVGNAGTSGALGTGGVTNNGLLRFSRTNALSVASNISGSGAVTQSATGGVTTLSGTNTYSGVTTVTAGTLLFNTTASLYNGNSADWHATNLVVNSAGILAVTLGGANGFTAAQVQVIGQLGTATGGLKHQSYFGIDTSNGDQTYSNVIANTNTAGSNQIGFVKVGANTLTLTADNTYAGGSSNGTRVFGGTLQIGNGGTSGTLGGGSVAISSGATLAFNRSDNITFAGNISGAGGVTQLGTGVLTFGTSKTYSGPTTVNAGTLKLGSGGAINSTPTITVASGATYDVSSVTGGYTLGSTSNQLLQGTGSVTGGVTVASGSTVRGDSGTGTGTLTTGNVTVLSGGRLGVQLGSGTAASQLNTSAGILNLNSGAIIDPNGTFDGAGIRTLAALSSGTGGLVVNGTNVDSQADIATYTYATGDTGLKPFGALQLDVTGLSLNNGEQLVLSRNASNRLVLSFTPVPEPAFLLAVCGLAVGGVVAVRKLRRKVKPADVRPAA